MYLKPKNYLNACTSDIHSGLFAARKTDFHSGQGTSVALDEPDIYKQRPESQGLSLSQLVVLFVDNDAEET